jgi:hypothetical protein
MFNRLSAVLCGLVIAGMMVLVAAQPARAAVPAGLCIGNWVNAPCVVAEVKLTPAAPRPVQRTVAPRREVHRSKRVARQKVAQQKVAQQKVVEQRPVRVAVRTAKVCTGNWVNAACAAP